MKLTADETRRLARGTDDNASILDIIDDACELLTLKVVLLLKKKAADIKEKMGRITAKTHARIELAAQVNILYEFLVDLAEHP